MINPVHNVFFQYMEFVKNIIGLLINIAASVVMALVLKNTKTNNGKNGRKEKMKNTKIEKYCVRCGENTPHWDIKCLVCGRIK
jgi:large-conductance mechanosensitive channel